MTWQAGDVVQTASFVLALRATPADDGELVSQLLFGECADILEVRGEYARVRALRDGYEGWADMAGFALPILPTPLRVSALRTYAFSAPDLKSPPTGLLSMHALLSPTGRRADRFVEVARAGWITAHHTAPAEAVTGDVAGTAEMFVHAPYLWGGRESLGLDCSALVQNAFQAAGRTIPRDTGDQEPALAGETHVKPDDLDRGDVVFWPGHVAIAIDHTRVIHANATAMAVSIDALTDLAARIQAQEGRAVSSIVRVGRDRPALTPDRPAMTVGTGADPLQRREPEQGA